MNPKKYFVLIIDDHPLIVEAYETALIGGDTSVILSPDSEFFKFFGNIKPKSE